MKYLFPLITSLFLFSINLNAQDCNPYFSYSEGTVVEHTYFNAKGKGNSTQQMTIKSVQKTASGQVMTAEVVLSDKKEDEIFSNEIELVCENGVFKMDMSRFIPPTAQTGGMGDISIEFEGDALEMPSSLSVGNTLNDATFIVKMKSDNPAFAAMMGGGTTTTISNRKVESKETITTAAGSFDCYKLTHDTRIETKVMGMKRVFENSSIEWISEG
ncbi:MAG: hypothetical protein AAGI07_19540, partial [Bacteroidota bacterium]